MIKHTNLNAKQPLPRSELPKKLTFDYLSSRVLPDSTVDRELIDALTWLAVRPLSAERRVAAVQTLLERFVVGREATIIRSVSALEQAFFVDTGAPTATVAYLRRSRVADALTGTFENAFIGNVVKLARSTFGDQSILDKITYNHNETFCRIAGRWFDRVTESFAFVNRNGI